MTITFIQISNVIDIITNSSSELFIINADQKKQVLIELVNNALKDTSFCVGEYNLEERVFNGEHHQSEEEWILNNFLEKLPVEKREKIGDFLKQPNYYGVVFDRDAGYPDYKHHEILKDLGFELVTSDY